MGVYTALTATAGPDVSIVHGYITTIGKTQVININITIDSTVYQNGKMAKNVVLAAAPIINGLGIVFHKNGDASTLYYGFIDNFGGNDGVCICANGTFEAGSYRSSFVVIVN